MITIQQFAIQKNMKKRHSAAVGNVACFRAGWSCVVLLFLLITAANAQGQFAGVFPIGPFSDPNVSAPIGGPSAIDPIRHIAYVAYCPSFSTSTSVGCTLYAFSEKDGSILAAVPYTSLGLTVYSALAVDPIQNKVYLGVSSPQGTQCGNPGAVMILDGNHDYSATTITLPGAPLQFAVNTHTQQLFAVTRGIASCSALSGGSPTPVPLYVVNPALVAVDSATGAITHSTPLTGQPVVGGLEGSGNDTLRINSASNTLYVAESTATLLSNNAGGPQLEFFSGTTGLSLGVFPTPSGVTTMAVDPIQNLFAAGFIPNGTTPAQTEVFTGTGTTYLNPNGSASGIQNYPILNPATSTLYVGTAMLTFPINDELFAYTEPGLAPFAASIHDLVPVQLASEPNIWPTVLDATTERLYSAGGLGVVSLAPPAPSKLSEAGTFGYGFLASPSDTNGLDPVLNQMLVTGTSFALHGDTQSTVSLASGAAPGGIAVNPSSGKAYVLNQGNNTVSVLRDGVLTGTTVALPGKPILAAVDGYADLVYVITTNAATAPGSVSVIDGSSDTLLGTVAVGKGPASIDVNPATGMAYMLNTTDQTVSVLNGKNLMATINVGKQPTQLAVDAARNRVYVANFVDATVTAIDGATGSTTVIQTGNGPSALAVDLPDNRVYVANQTDHSICFIDGTNFSAGCTTLANDLGLSLGDDPTAIILNPNIHTGYVVTNPLNPALGSSFWAFDTNSNSLINGLALPGNVIPGGAALDPILNRLAVVYQASGPTIGFVEQRAVVGAAYQPGFSDQLPVGNQPTAVAIDSPNHLAYVTNASDNSVTVTAEEQTYPSPLTVAITPLPQNLSTSLSPSFTLTVDNAFAPNAPPIDGVFFSFDSWQSAWQTAAATGTASTYTAAAPEGPGLLPGLHILYAYATNGMEAYGGDMDGSLLIGQIAAYPFLVSPSLAVVTPPPVTVTVSPPTASVFATQTQPFSAKVMGTTNTSVTWSVDESTGGTISTGGLYTAPAVAGTYHVRATSAASPTVFGEAAVMVTLPPVVGVSPPTASVVPLQTQQFAGIVSGTTNTAVTWSVVEPGGGSVSATGLYTAPATAGTYHVLVTSAVDLASFAEATVTVVPASTPLTIPTIKEPITVNDAVFISPMLTNFAPPAAYFSTAGMGFNGTPGQTQTLTMYNVGGAPLVFSGPIQITPGFAIISTVCSNGAASLPASLPSGGQCSFTISYAGTSPNGTIAFTDNAALSSPPSTASGAGYTQTIALSGSGTGTGTIALPPTTVSLNIPEMITVNDAPTASTPCQANVSSDITVTRGPYFYSPATHIYEQTVTLTNSGSVSIPGPISLVIPGVSANGKLFNPTGVTTCAAPGSLYVTDAIVSLAPSGSTKVLLYFTDPSHAAFTYGTQVEAGSGAP
jgi:DNA-binding beta-propeller fold protein YncE